MNSKTATAEPGKSILKSQDQNYRETFLLQFRAGALLLWEAIMTVLLVVTPRSFRDGGTESKVDTLSRVSENNYVGGGLVAVAPALMWSPVTWPPWPGDRNTFLLLNGIFEAVGARTSCTPLGMFSARAPSSVCAVAMFPDRAFQFGIDDKNIYRLKLWTSTPLAFCHYLVWSFSCLVLDQLFDITFNKLTSTEVRKLSSKATTSLRKR